MTETEFTRAVEEFYQPLYRFGLSLSGNEPDARDLTQETFYLCASKAFQLRDTSKLKSWLFTTLYREFLGRKRKETRFPHINLDLATPELPAIAPEVIAQLDGATLVELLQQVDELYRAPLVLFYLEEHSYAEIAGILDVPPGTVMSRLARGKDQLRRLIAATTADTAQKIIPLHPQREHKQPRHG